jgi:hypothetical protein
MRNLLSILVLLPLAACGGDSPKQLTDMGVQALAGGQAREAQGRFEEALQGLRPTDPDFVRATLGRVQALARLKPEAARDAFLTFSRENKTLVQESDYGMVVSELLRAGASMEAIDVMDAGMKAYPASAQMKAVQKQVTEAAKQSKDPAGLNKLKGLGYVGDH